ncbi:unnamed protein product [Amoebophrya sp. A25]|nr:unnamed protein product [Amoebophrya sp. A25]|eukprot:GSA25T00020463001.1
MFAGGPFLMYPAVPPAHLSLQPPQGPLEVGTSHMPQAFAGGPGAHLMGSCNSSSASTRERPPIQLQSKPPFQQFQMPAQQLQARMPAPQLSQPVGLSQPVLSVPARVSLRNRNPEMNPFGLDSKGSSNQGATGVASDSGDARLHFATCSSSASSTAPNTIQPGASRVPSTIVVQSGVVGGRSVDQTSGGGPLEHHALQQDRAGPSQMGNFAGLTRKALETRLQALESENESQALEILELKKKLAAREQQVQELAAARGVSTRRNHSASGQTLPPPCASPSEVEALHSSETQQQFNSPSPAVVSTSSRAGRSSRNRVSTAKPMAPYTPLDGRDPVDNRLAEFYNSTGSAVPFLRINKGFYRYGRTTMVELSIINHKLMAKTEDGWNHGKFGAIEKFMSTYEPIERERLGLV